METAAKIYAGLGGIGSIFVIIGGLWVTSQTFATDAEVEVAKGEIINEIHQVSVVHALDKVSAEEARKNDRIDRVDRDIRKLNRLIEFGDLVERKYNLQEKQDLLLLRQNILEGHR